MCIIIDKKENVKVNWSMLKNCDYNNEDGIGFMLYHPKNNEIIYKKGFFNFNRFKKYMLNKYGEKFLKEASVAFHFRIATNGGINDVNCHPFNLDNLKSVEGKTDFAYMHNGIISIYAHNSKISDTFLFGKKALKPLKNVMDDNKITSLLEDILESSKVLIYRIHNGKFEKIFLNKRFFITDKKYNGYYFSNDTYKKDKYLWTNSNYQPRCMICNKLIKDERYVYDGLCKKCYKQFESNI